MKTHVTMVNPRHIKEGVAGSIYPFPLTTTTTTTPTTPPPPTPPPTPLAPPTPPPAVSGKVQVFIMMGQSNMLGEGKINGWTDGTLETAVVTKGLYPYLLDGDHWAQVDHIRDVAVMGGGGPTGDHGTVHHNEWLSVNPSKKTTIGPELGIGFELANATDAPVMLLKSCIGNRALGWDLLPPGSEQYECTVGDKTYIRAGYGDSPQSWEKGTEPVPIAWHAGIQYDGDLERVDIVLKNEFEQFYPGATDYEVAGFFWWQGDRDSRDNCLADRYEFNLVNMIKALRQRYNAPNAKFVTASLGQTVKGSTGGDGKILDAMLAVDGESGKYPEFQGNVAAVYSHPFSKGGSSGAHYGGNAETYMNIGEAMGVAMATLVKSDSVSYV